MNIWQAFNITKILLITICFCEHLGNGNKIELSAWGPNGEPNSYLDSFLRKSICSYSTKSLDECEDDRDAFLQYLILPKRKEYSTALTQDFSASKMHKSIRTPPTFLSKGHSCSCVMESRLEDLGIMYFPRHIPIVVCKPGGCFGGPYQCRPKLYKIQVLKQKQADNLNQEEMISGIVPHNLRDLFISVTINVTVACECLP